MPDLLLAFFRLFSILSDDVINIKKWLENLKINLNDLDWIFPVKSIVISSIYQKMGPHGPWELVQLKICIFHFYHSIYKRRVTYSAFKRSLSLAIN